MFLVCLVGRLLNTLGARSVGTPCCSVKVIIIVSMITGTGVLP